jgi:ABC-type transporter Mla maintaining outer membrane lipid asymmetry ATPase subunit MlaF
VRDIIELVDVGVSFAGEMVVKELTLGFFRGRTTVIIGTSGSGKSQLLKAAAGLVIPEEGEVLFEGRDIGRMNYREYQQMQARTGFMFQDAALWANMSLREHLSLPVLAAEPHLQEEEVDRRIDQAMEEVDLLRDPGVRPAALSQGERKLLSYLRATITDPEVLFLDEPTSFLDLKGSRLLVAGIDRYREEDKTLVVATHDQALGAHIADHLVVLHKGRVVAEGPHYDVMESDDPAVREVLQDLR